MARFVFVSALALAACGGEMAVPFDDGQGAVVVGTTAVRLEYPAPPYGSRVGATLENFQFLGWSSPKDVAFDASRLEPRTLAEFYDPTGQKGIRYLLITSTAVWCSACKAEYRDMAAKVAGYEARGVAFLGALFEDNQGGPAAPADLHDWGKQFAVTFPFVLDPDLKLGAFFDVEATPMVMIVDTKKMEIVSLEEGWASSGAGSAWAFLDAKLPK